MTSDSLSRHLDDSWIEEDLLACFKGPLPIHPITPDIPISPSELGEYRALLENLTHEGAFRTCASEGSEPPAGSNQSQSTIGKIILGDTRRSRHRAPSVNERQMFYWPVERVNFPGRSNNRAAFLSELLLPPSKSSLSIANRADTTVKWARNLDEPVPLSLNPHLYRQLLSQFPRAPPDACLDAMQAVEDVMMSMTDARHAFLDEANQSYTHVKGADWQGVVRWIEMLWGENSELLQNCRARLEGIFSSTNTQLH